MITSIALLSYGNHLIIESKGASSRIHKELLTPGLLKVVSDPIEFHINNYGGHGYELDNTLGEISGKKIAVMAGDSFGLQYASGMDKILHDRDEYISGFFRHGCIMSTRYTRLMNNTPRQACKDAYKLALSELKDNNLPLILAHSWEDYSNIIANSDGINSQQNGTSYFEVIEDILTSARHEIGNRKLFIIGSQPYMRATMGSALCILRPTYIAQPCTKWLKYPIELSTAYKTNKLLKKFADTHPNTFYIDATPTLCKAGICTTILDGKLMYSDASHLSIAGSVLTSKQILDNIKNSK
ncbi:putative lipopolysaccharide modification acyltransferase [Pseudomonas sp. St29]|nr:putative lipopolysaccharide modification acyltransferase [Pseudomonas sp. St29]